MPSGRDHGDGWHAVKGWIETAVYIKGVDARMLSALRPARSSRPFSPLLMVKKAALLSFTNEVLSLMIDSARGNEMWQPLCASMRENLQLGMLDFLIIVDVPSVFQ